jgi:hypothetical protein
MFGRSLICIAAVVIVGMMATPARAQYPCGDVNGSGGIDLLDFILLVHYTVDADSTISHPEHADMNSFPGIDASDVTYMVEFIWHGGLFPCAGGPAGDDMIPGGEVTLEFVAGQSGPAVVAAGYPLTFNVKVTNNTDRYVMGMANGFNLYSPDGANIGNIDLPPDTMWWAELGYGSTWTFDPIAGEPFGNMGFSIGVWQGWDPDTTYPPGMPPGFTGISYHINVEPFGDEDIGKTICFDSAYFGNAGEWMWAVDGDNTLHPSWDGPHCFTIEDPAYVPGDVDWDGEVAIGDLVWLVEYMFQSGPAPPIMEACDLNGDCIKPDISDLVYLVEYMFDGGDSPLFSCTRPAGKMATAGDLVSLTSYVENGITMVDVNSTIDIAGIQLELSTSDEPGSVQSGLNQQIEVVHGCANDRLKIGVLDLDGAVTIDAGNFNMIRIEGECQLVSATVADLNCTSIQPTLHRGRNTQMPTGFALHQNYPNPFNSSTVISFSLEQGSDVQLKVFDLTGREVTILVDRALPAGLHSFTWNGKTSDGSETASGVYFYRMTAGGTERTQKMMYLK